METIHEFYNCLKSRDLARLKQFIDKNPDFDFNKKYPGGDHHLEYGLHYAIHHSSLEIVKFLLSIPDINYKQIDYDGNSVLHLACYYDKKELVKYLFTLPEFRDVISLMANSKGENLLHILCYDNTEVFDSFPFEDSDIEEDTNEKIFSIIKFILSHSHLAKLLEQQDTLGNTPLHCVFSNQYYKVLLSEDYCNNYKYYQIAKYLLSFPNAPIYVKNNYGATILHEAIRSDYYCLVKLLCSNPEIRQGLGNVKDENGNTPLMLSVGSFKIFKHLCSFPEILNFSAYQKNNDGDTILHELSIHRDCLLYFLSKFSGHLDFNQKNNDGETPIFNICRNTFGQNLDILMTFDLDLTITNEKGETALDVASKNEYFGDDKKLMLENQEGYLVKKLRIQNEIIKKQEILLALNVNPEKNSKNIAKIQVEIRELKEQL